MAGGSVASSRWVALSLGVSWRCEPTTRGASAALPRSVEGPADWLALHWRSPMPFPKMGSMKNRLLAAPLAAIVLSLVLIAAFSASTPSDGVFFVSVLTVALLL